MIRVPLNQQRPLVFLRRGTREHGGGRAKCGICLALARLCSGFNLFLGGPIGLLNRNGIFAFLGRPEGCVCDVALQSRVCRQPVPLLPSLLLAVP